MCRMATLNGGRPIDGSSGCLVISGVPGAGKSTVASLVADGLPRSAVTDADALARMVRSGWVGPIGEPADEARAQVMLRTRNACLLAGSFAEAGFFPVIDHVVSDRENARGQRWHLTYRPPEPETRPGQSANASTTTSPDCTQTFSVSYPQEAGGSIPQRSAQRTRPRGSSLRPAREQSSPGNRGAGRTTRSRSDTDLRSSATCCLDRERRWLGIRWHRPFRPLSSCKGHRGELGRQLLVAAQNVVLIAKARRGGRMAVAMHEIP